MLRLTATPGIEPEALGELGAMFGIAVLITDSGARGVHVNSQWQTLTGSRTPHPQGGWITAFEAADRTHIDAGFAKARLSGSSDLACRLSTTDGPVRVELRICRMSSAAGDVQGFVIGLQRRLT